MVVCFAQFWKYYLLLTLFTLYASMPVFASGEISLMDIISIVSCDENGYYRVFSVGQLSFDCRSFSGRSRRMQGFIEKFKFVAICVHWDEFH